VQWRTETPKGRGRVEGAPPLAGSGVSRPASAEKSDYELLKPFLSKGRLQRIEEVLSGRTDRLALVLENIYDPHNLSAILRTVEGMGIQNVYLAGSFPRSLNPDIAIGAERWLTLHRDPDPAYCLERIRGRGYTVAVTVLDSDAEDPWEWEPRGPVALVLGNEHDGVSGTFRGGADRRLRLPMPGFTRSFNVSVACSLLIGALSRKDFMKPRGLAESAAAVLRDEWARRSVARSEEILRRLRKEGG